MIDGPASWRPQVPFRFWWTGVAGDFKARPISEAGVDVAFLLSVAVLTFSLAAVLFAIAKLQRLRAT